MKSTLRKINDNGRLYESLAFICPGCAEREGATGLNMLPVRGESDKKWEWDGNFEVPTLAPSILTQDSTGFVCHSFLRGGVFEFLGDCTHSLANQKVPMPDLPEWFIKEREQ